MSCSVCDQFKLYGNDFRGIFFVCANSGIGQKKAGVHLGPQHVLSEKLFKTLRSPAGPWFELEVSVADEVRIPTDYDPKSTLKVKPHESMSVRATCEQVRIQVERAVMRNFFPVMVGGDHCLAMGSIAASAKRFPDVCVIWVDAHADINVPATSDSGNMHGMPVAALLGLPGMSEAPGFESNPFKCLSPDRVGYIGLRDVDAGEKEILKRLGMDDAAFSASDVHRFGIQKVIAKILAKINPGDKRPIHLSFDVDGVDPCFMPSTGTAVHQGLSMQDALTIFHTLKKTGLLVSCDVVEVNPKLGTGSPDANVTVENTQLLLQELLLPDEQMSPLLAKLSPQCKL